MCVRTFFLKLVLVFSFTSNIPFSRLPAPDMRLVNLVTRAFPLKNGRSSPGDEVGVTCHSALNIASYDSFKIFTPFWLAKSTRIIHHNQSLMWRILCLTWKWCQKCSLLQVNALLTEKTWGWGWVVFIVKTKMVDTSLVSRVRTTAGTRRNNG